MEKYFNRVTIIILLGSGAALIGVFLLWPVLQEFSRVERELEQYNTALAGREKYVLDLAILGKRLDAKREAIRKIEIAIPGNTSIPALFDLLQKISISSGLVLTEVETSVKKDSLVDLNLTTTEMSIEITGTYDALKAFIAQVKSSAQLLEITSLSLYGRGAAELLGQEQFQFTLELQTYAD